MEQYREPEINPCLYGQLIFDKGSKSIQGVKDSLFSKWCCDNWIDTHTHTQILDHILTPYNSKWIKNLNVSYKTVKILEEIIGSKISNTSHRKILSDISPWARETKEKNLQMEPSTK